MPPSGVGEASRRSTVEDAGAGDVLVVHILSHGYVDEHTEKLRVIGADGRHTGRTEVERWLTDVEGRRDGTGEHPPVRLHRATNYLRSGKVAAAVRGALR